MRNLIQIMIAPLLAACFVTLGVLAQQTLVTSSDSPTDAYTRLYVAVKSKDTEAIKKAMTLKTIEFAGLASKKNNTPIERVFENGFTATTFASSLPEIRDGRINGNMGAVEVWNSEYNTWEDLPFIYEDGAWKLAIGDLFGGTFKSPGKGRSALELEAANRNETEAAKAVVPNSNRGSKTPDYKITNIKILPFNEATGKFEDELTHASDRSFFNDLSTSLFVTFEVSGKAGSFEAGRRIITTVTEGKRVKFTKTEQVGLIGSEGKYFVPVWLYSSMCSDVKITARLSGQKTASTMTRKVPFMCGE